MSQIDWVACERLIGSLASKFVQDGLDLEDLKQEARLAVLETHHDYTPEMKVSLNTFIGRRIRDALRKYAAANTDAFEVSREWVAESIADGPDGALRADSKAECNALRDVVGADKFRKPRRVIETVRATVSLDADTGCNCEGDTASMSLHEQIGIGPEQELGMLAAEMTKTVTSGLSRKGEELSEIFRLRSEGHTFKDIAKKLGKETRAVELAFQRAQKKLNKKRAA
jgi:RNA polymerase sigma factor (sigma-70 family)